MLQTTLKNHASTFLTFSCGIQCIYMLLKKNRSIEKCSGHGRYSRYSSYATAYEEGDVENEKIVEEAYLVRKVYPVGGSVACKRWI